jgi:hypothetical protein
MQETDKTPVASLSEFREKPTASAHSDQGREEKPSWRRRLLAGFLFGLSMIASVYFQPLAQRILE